MTAVAAAQERLVDARTRADGRKRTARRRQIGTERHAPPPSILHAAPTRRAVSSARFALLATAIAWVLAVWDHVRRLAAVGFGIVPSIEVAVYLVLVTLLTVSASAYLLARLGFLKQVRDHQRAPRAVLDAFFATRRPDVTVIVPSYREEHSTILQTVLSAALQEYPGLRVVLLVDDPPTSNDPAHRAMREAALAVPAEIAALLDPPRTRAVAALESFERSVLGATSCPVVPLVLLAEEFAAAAAWLEGYAQSADAADHATAFFVTEALLHPAADFRAIAAALNDAVDAGAPISVERARQLHNRLVWTFDADVSAFERKTFASLSHEPNKAMNLNSYIGLMGGRFRVEASPAGRVLLPADRARADLVVPYADYVLTLDADSVLLPEYCLRLVHLLEQPGNERIAIAQTPYSAFRNAATRLERMAGATTDLQHIAHLGMTRYGATSWVGANAVIRRAALDDIVVEGTEGGFPVRRYIQDRTVIEDTESTLDLRLNGWQLHNVPERLAYSATPPDFGALCVQRQRWANGGLLCLGKLRRLMKQPDHRGRFGRWIEWMLRANYLASLTWATIGLTVLLAYPFDQRLLSGFSLLTAIPYFVAQATDLRRCGYRRSDVLRLYGFNLLLLPVNGSGALKSIVQGIAGQRSAFARTPKVRSRTVAPALFVAVPWLIIGWSALTLVNDLLEQRWAHGVFAGSNAVLTLYAVVAFHGLRYSVADLFISANAWIRTPPKAGRSTANPAWVTVLYHGPTRDGEQTKVDALAAAMAALDRQAGERPAAAVLTVPAATGWSAEPAAVAVPVPVIDLRDPMPVRSPFGVDVVEQERA